MISAKETVTGKTWNIRHLEEMDRNDPGAWDRMKADTLWECIECGGRAYPRRRSKDGRAATWSAKHREEPACDLKSRTIITELGSVDRYQDPVANTGTVLQLLFEHGTKSNRPHEIHADDSGPGAGARRGVGYGDGPLSSTHEKTQRLGAMLGHLMADPDYVEGLNQNRIKVPDRGEVRLADLIWRFDELDPDNADLVGKHVVVWGVVRTVSGNADLIEERGPVYFNQDLQGDSRGAIEVSLSSARRLLDLHTKKIDGRFWGLTWWYVIAYGLTRATYDGKRVVVVSQDHSTIALRQGPTV